MDIEKRVREIANNKGIRLSDLASKLGVSQSNIIKSLRKNPTLNTLKDIALALGVRVVDIIDTQRIATDGFAVINGRTYAISKPISDVVQVPVYNFYPVLKAEVSKFSVVATQENRDNSICGYVESMLFFNLTYNAVDKVFMLTLCYGKGKVETFRYSIYEYGDGEKWDIVSLIEIYHDIEGHVPYVLGEEDSKLTQVDVDRAVASK